MNYHLPSAGDLGPDVVLKAHDGKEWNLRSDAIAGNPIVILFCPRLTAEGKQALALFARQSEALAAEGAKMFAITSDKADDDLPEFGFPVLLDRREDVFARFSVPRDQISTVVLRRNHHIAGIYKGDQQSQIGEALAMLKSFGWERTPAVMPIHPPVLFIPDVFSREDCARLLDIFENKGQTFFEPQPAYDLAKGADYKMRIPEHMREDRIDHFFFEKGTVEFLKNRMNRIYPEIYKAFHYRITKYETLRIARYEGHRGGHSHGHRDNIPPWVYRRFALSINLNTPDFEGGDLRFPEFGEQRYRPDSGTAVVFSSSLLHEAMHVTAGRRYVFLAFLFGDI